MGTWLVWEGSNTSPRGAIFREPFLCAQGVSPRESLPGDWHLVFPDEFQQVLVRWWQETPSLQWIYVINAVGSSGPKSRPTCATKEAVRICWNLTESNSTQRKHSIAFPRPASTSIWKKGRQFENRRPSEHTCIFRGRSNQREASVQSQVSLLCAEMSTLLGQNSAIHQA